MFPERPPHCKGDSEFPPNLLLIHVYTFSLRTGLLGVDVSGVIPFLKRLSSWALQWV